MALTVTITGRDRTSTRHITTGDMLFDSSYQSGGENLTANDVGLSDWEVSSGLTLQELTPGYQAWPSIIDSQNARIRLEQDRGASGTFTELAGGTDVSTTRVKFTATGW